MPPPTSILEKVRTPFSEIEVWQTLAGGIDFDVTGATHATWHPDYLLTGMAWDAMAAGMLSHPTGQPQSLLILGLGGGTSLRQIRHLLPRLKITAVEIDHEMVRLARKYMELDSLDTRVIIGDAYEVINELDEQFDVVFDDVYHDGPRDVERPQGVGDQLLQRLNQLRAPGGILAANFVTGKGHREMQSTARAAFCAAFPEVRSIRPTLSYNETLIGGDQLFPVRNIRKQDTQFPHPRDRRRWGELKIRSIQQRGSSRTK